MAGKKLEFLILEVLKMAREKEAELVRLRDSRLPRRSNGQVSDRLKVVPINIRKSQNNGGD